MSILEYQSYANPPKAQTTDLTVSVCMVTYNHGHLIGQAIESVFAQQTDFRVELVIGEDCSTDNTRAIIASYQQRYPDRIRLLTQEKNLGDGGQPNFIITFNACTGEFIAILEGDDYWTDSNKLQLQVDSLRSRPDCSFCFHDAKASSDEGSESSWIFSERFSHILPPLGGTIQTYSQLDLARWGWFIPTASMLLRANSLPSPLPDWFAGIHSGDFTMQLLSTRHGLGLYLPKIMSHYRLHPQSITSTTTHTSYQYSRHIYAGKMLQKHVFEPKYRKHADIYLAQQYDNYANYLGRQGQRWQQLKYLSKAMLLHLQRIPLLFERQLSRFTDGPTPK